MAKTVDQVAAINNITMKQISGEITGEEAKKLLLKVLYGCKVTEHSPELSWNDKEYCVELKCGQGKPRQFKTKESLMAFYADDVLNRASELLAKFDE